jgi:predicted nucleic acid-binding protein
MTAIFADTFYWVALTNVRDSAHEQAKKFSRSLPSASFVTTEPVLIEYLTILHDAPARSDRGADQRPAF